MSKKLAKSGAGGGALLKKLAAYGAKRGAWYIIKV